MNWAEIRMEPDLNIPLYQQLANRIRNLIASGALKPGERIPVSRALQSGFHLSSMTVENGISILVRERYLVRRPRIGTFVSDNPPLSNAPEKHPPVRGCVKVLFSSIIPFGHYWFSILFELEEALKKHGCELVFHRYNGNPEETAEFLMRDSVGAVLCGTNPLEIARILNARTFPMVLIGSTDRDDKLLRHLDIVMHNDVQTSYLTVKHLLMLGHRRITVISAPVNSKYGDDLRKGAIQARDEYQIPEENFRIVALDVASFETGLQTGAAELCREPRCSAMMVTDGPMASGVLKAATKLGVRVPEDLSLITMGSSWLCEQTSPPLTGTGSADEPNMVEAMVERLFRQITDPSHKQEPLILESGKIVFRSSTQFYKGALK